MALDLLKSKISITMRAVPLAKTLGVGSFAGLQAAVGTQFSSALGGFSKSGFSNQAFQHTKVQNFAPVCRDPSVPYSLQVL